MIPIDQNSPMKSILPFVKNWFQLLSLNKFDEACTLLDEPNCYGMVWSQKKTIELLDEIFCIGTNFREQFPEGPVFSDPFDLKEVRELEVGEYEDGSGYWFDYAVPLNGELSDLAAQFKFKKRKKRFAAILHDLHVM